MTLNSTNIPIFGPIGPLGPKDTYPTHEAIYGKGGLIQVKDITARDAIPLERRVEGMQVLIQEPDVGSDPTVYVLVNGITNDKWAVLNYSTYSTSYGPQLIFSELEPSERKGGASIIDGDLWVELPDYYLYAYSGELNTWIQLTGSNGGGVVSPTNPSSIFPGVRPRFPENVLPISSDAWDNGTTTLTATGCILISLDNVTYNQGPLTINDDDVLWTRWSLDNSCAGAEDGTLIEGRITNGVKYEDGDLTLDKVPNNFFFNNLIDQAISSVSTSNQIVLGGLNADTKVWAPIGSGSNREISINGGAWTALPSSYGSALTVPYIDGGPTIKVRHTNSAEINTTSILEVRVGDTDTDSTRVKTTWSTKTAASGPSIAQPSILTPVNNSIGIAIPTTITSSTYSAFNGAAAHASSDWQVNSGALNVTSTNSITNMTYINTDLGPNRWIRLGTAKSVISDSLSKKARYLGVGATASSNYLYSVGPYIEGMELIKLDSSTNYESYFTVMHYAYSPKYNRQVAVGFSGGLGVISYFDGDMWRMADVDNSDNRYGGFTHVIWNAKNQKFIAVRSYSGDESRIVFYTSSDGTSFTEVDYVATSNNSTAPIRDYGDFIDFAIRGDGNSVFRGYSVTSSDATNFTLDTSPPHPRNNVDMRTGPSVWGVGGLKLRNKWANISQPLTVSYYDKTVIAPGGLYTSSDYINWDLLPGTETNSTYLNKSYFEIKSYRADHDAFFFYRDGNIYYTLDGESVLPCIDSYAAYEDVWGSQTFTIIADQAYYYLWVTTQQYGATVKYRANRTMINITIDGANLDGFSLGQRIKVDGVPYTYGWIHEITDTTVTIRGAYGDWSNVTGRHISADNGDAGLGLIVNLTDNVDNKTSYTVPSELMSANIDYYTRVRHSDGSIKSSWSPWSKFTT